MEIHEFGILWFICLLMSVVLLCQIHILSNLAAVGKSVAETQKRKAR